MNGGKIVCARMKTARFGMLDGAKGAARFGCVSLRGKQVNNPQFCSWIGWEGKLVFGHGSRVVALHFPRGAQESVHDRSIRMELQHFRVLFNRRVVAARHIQREPGSNSR